MELGEVFRTIWRRLWLIVLGTLAFSVAVFAISRNMQPIYQAKVTMMVNPSQSAPFVDQASMLTGEDLALTYSELLKMRPFLEIVIANLNLDLTPQDLLEDMLGTELVPGTQLLTLSVEDTDAQRASDIANEIVFTFISSHNTEQQLQNIVSLEQDVVAQMSILRNLIERTHATVDQSRMSSSLLTEEESSIAQTALIDQQLAYITLLQTYLNVRQMQTQLLDITVVEPAVVPETPIRPNILIYTFLGTFIGLVFSVGLIFLIEYLDYSLKTVQEVTRLLSLATLGMIPRLQGRDRRAMRMRSWRRGLRHDVLPLSTLELPHSVVAEAYRALRMNIRFAQADKMPRVLLMTSAGPDVDKTAVTANLGVACAQAGLRVVLIDTNLRFPQLHRLLGVDQDDLNAAQTGLSDLLAGGGLDVQKCMIKTKIQRLHLISGGSIPDDPSELLGSKRMDLVLSQVSENADLVLLDTPPVLAVTDAVILASKEFVRQTGGVILVIEAGRTSYQIARRACEVIERAGATILGAVLTKVEPKEWGSAYRDYVAKGKRSRSGSIVSSRGRMPAKNASEAVGKTIRDRLADIVKAGHKKGDVAS